MRDIKEFLEIAENYDYYYRDKENETGISAEKEVDKKKKRFLKTFTKRVISEKMTLEQYYSLKKDGESFARWLSEELKPIGSLGNVHPYRWFIGAEKDFGQKILENTELETKTQKLFIKTKKAISKIIDAAERNKVEELAEIDFFYGIKFKIFYIYCKNVSDLPIFSDTHVNKIINFFDIQYKRCDNKRMDEIAKRQAIYSFKKEYFDFMTNREFMLFLYDDMSGLYLKYKAINSKKDKHKNALCEEDEYKNFVGTNLCKLINKECQNEKASDFSSFSYKIADKKSIIGEMGEKFVIKQERIRLKSSNCSELVKYSKKIKSVSKDHTKGYDIESFDYINNKIVNKHIEVKTKVNGSINNVDFYITYRELDQLEKDPFYVIYYVCGIKKEKGRKIFIITKDILETVKKSPILYRVKAMTTI